MSKTKECFAYNTKIIETPTTKEVYIYENPIFIHSKEKADLTDTSNRKKFDEMSAHKQYDSLKRKQKLPISEKPEQNSSLKGADSQCRTTS